MTTFTSWDTELCHSGKKGMKWGFRRYQNEDGSLTPLGRIHYGIGKARERSAQKKIERADKAAQKKEERRRSNIKTMTESELRAAINRKKLENEYKDLSRSKTAETLVNFGSKALDFYEEAKRRNSEEQEKKRAYQLEVQRLKNDNYRAKAEYNDKLSEVNKVKLEQDKWDSHAGRAILKKEAKTSLLKVKNDEKRIKLEKQKNGWFVKWRDQLFAKKQEDWRANERKHELESLELKNLGQQELTEQAKARVAAAEQETKKAEHEYNKQNAYNEGKRQEYAENAAKRQYDREERIAKEREQNRRRNRNENRN